MRTKHWPAAERPRERLLRHGAEALSDAELLALLLVGATRQGTALDAARALLSRFGSLRAALDADREAFCRLPGLGASGYAALQSALELARRHMETRLRRGAAFSSPSDTSRYVSARLRRHHNEVFACLFLDNRHRLIRYEELFRGTVNGASVHPREIARAALRHNAAALIVAHNHPSGIAEPSLADRAITNRIRDAMTLIDVRLTDHLVVGDAEVVSFAERGWL